MQPDLDEVGPPRITGRNTAHVTPAPFDDIAATIRARHVLTPMDLVTVCIAEDSAEDSARILADKKFDAAPAAVAGTIVGYVERDDLVALPGTATSDHIRPLTAEHLVSGDAPLEVLLRVLSRAPFQVVIDGARVAGIVTAADLNKQPGRTYFYLLVAELELTMAELIRKHFPDQQEALALLAPERCRQIQQRQIDEVRADVFADEVAAMDFVDLLAVVKKTDDLRAAFGSHSRTQWQDRVSAPVTKLRHDVMHTVRALVGDASSSLERLTALDALLRGLLSVAGARLS